MLSKSLLVFFALEVFLVVNIVVRSFWVPVVVAHLVLFLEVFLRPPPFRRAVGVLGRWEWAFVLWDIHLILGHQIVQPGILLVFKESVGNSKIVVGMNDQRKLTWNWIPRVFVHFPDRGITKDHLSHLIIGS